MSRNGRGNKHFIEKNPKRFLLYLVIFLVVMFACIMLYHFGLLNFLFIDEDIPELGKAEGDLRVHFVDVGQGDGIFIELPDGKNMIIDSGMEGEMLPYLNALNIDKIDYAVLTHGDQDHLEDFPDIFDAYEILCVYMGDFDTDQIPTQTYKRFYDAVYSEEGAEIIFSTDDTDIMGSDYIIDFNVYIEDYDSNVSGVAKNAVSPLMFLTYANRKVLFTGDSNELNEKYFVEGIIGSGSEFDVDILKVGHHGGDSSSTVEFLEVVKPEYAVIQCGEGNAYGHPQQDTLDRLSNYILDSENLYRNDTNGDVVLTITREGEINFNEEITLDNPSDNFEAPLEKKSMSYHSFNNIYERSLFY